MTLCSRILFLSAFSRGKPFWRSSKWEFLNLWSSNIKWHWWHTYHIVALCDLYLGTYQAAYTRYLMSINIMQRIFTTLQTVTVMHMTNYNRRLCVAMKKIPVAGLLKSIGESVEKDIPGEKFWNDKRRKHFQYREAIEHKKKTIALNWRPLSSTKK